MARRIKAKGTRRRTKLHIIYTRAAGIDVGSTFHVVAVPPELSAEPVHTFQTFTGDLYRLAHWLVDIGVTTVAMASTGIYWIPVFDILEAHGLEVLLVNAQHGKTVPGRKTDVNDAQWMQQLHTYGLLRGSFHPAQDWSALRVYLRHRERFVEYAAAHIQHMQKALMHMNLQLHHVLSDITGMTGMKIMRAMVAGQHDPAVLATYRDARCKASEETIRAALTGHYRREHVFALRQALELYDSYQARIEACDQEVKSTLESLQNAEIAIDSLPAARHKKQQSHEPQFDVREALFRVLGVDLSQIDGFSPYTALKLVGECGIDMRRWPTEKHFTSWLTLAPGNKISGGKVLNTKTRRSANRAAAIFRLSAMNVGQTHTALGAPGQACDVMPCPRSSPKVPIAGRRPVVMGIRDTCPPVAQAQRSLWSLSSGASSGPRPSTTRRGWSSRVGRAWLGRVPSSSCPAPPAACFHPGRSTPARDPGRREAVCGSLRIGQGGMHTYMEQSVTDPRGSRACADAEGRRCEWSRRSVVAAPGAVAIDFMRPREGAQIYPVGESDPTRHAHLAASTLGASAPERRGATVRRLATGAAAQIVLYADDDMRRAKGA